MSSPITTGSDGHNGPFLLMLHGLGTDQSVWNHTDTEGHFPHLSKPGVVLDAFHRHLKR